jgi:ribonucleoside-diphosphate reductase alpha chain
MNAVQSTPVMAAVAPVATAVVEPEMAATDIKFCAIDDPGCEACQ